MYTEKPCHQAASEHRTGHSTNEHALPLSFHWSPTPQRDTAEVEKLLCPYAEDPDPEDSGTKAADGLRKVGKLFFGKSKKQRAVRAPEHQRQRLNVRTVRSAGK